LRAATSRIATLARLIGKLRGRSLRELRERGMQALSAALEPHTQRFLERGRGTDLATLFDASALRFDPTSPDLLIEHFATRTTPAFFPGVRDGSSRSTLRSSRWSAERAAVTEAADRVLDGRFDLLGYRQLSFGTPIDWHLDPTSGRRAPFAHWNRIPYLDAGAIGDHKVIWELNRHQHLMLLGRAYQATGDERYAITFRDHVVSWLEANPPKRGVNWASSLEVAYRAIAWLWSLELFRDSTSLDAALLQRMLRSLDVHGRHLERYLSTYFSPNTHLTGEALGLFYLGVMLPELRRAARWRTLGWSILERELQKQIHDDGVYFEQATYYHRYTVDINLHALLLARANGLPVPPAFRRRLEMAVEHLADIVRPDGTIPLIGDDDGGRLVALEERHPSNVRAALGTGALVFDRPDIAAVAGSATEEVLWLLGPDEARRLDAMADSPPPPHLSRLYPTGGFAILRDGWGPRANHAVIDAGPLGALNAGHAHADQLSISISALGCPVLVDPGSFTYTVVPAERDRFRHAAMHNTVTVDGQSSSVPAGPFAWKTRADARIDAWWPGTLVDHFTGSHGGFARLPDPVEHRRTVLFVRGSYWVVIDSVSGREHHESTAHFHLALGSSVVPLSSRSARIQPPCGGLPDGIIFAVAGDVDALEWEQDWVSDAYGTRDLAPVARVITRGSGTRRLVTLLLPALDGQPASVEELPCTGGRLIAVEHAGSHDLLVFRHEGVVRAGAMEMDADAALIRRASRTGPIGSVALFGPRARLSVDAFEFHASGSAEMTARKEGWAVEGSGRVTSR
jgi:hypothetical protein